MCGATSAQSNIQAQQQQSYQTAINQAQSLFGNSSKVFNDLVNTYSPIVQAGPNQQGYSPTELSAMNSSAITNIGNQYKNEKQALGDQAAAQGGGTANLPGGAILGRQASLAENYGNQTAGTLNAITQANYNQGRQNWAQAAQGLAGSTGVFGQSTDALNAATGSGKAASDTANQIAQDANSPWQAVIGAAGAVAGQAAGGLAGGFSGGGSTSADNAATTVAQQMNYDPSMYSENGSLNAIGGPSTYVKGSNPY